MSMTPKFQGVFSQSEGRLGQALKKSRQRDVGQALNYAIQKQNIEIARNNQRLKREEFEYKKRAADLAAAQEANLAPFKVAKLEQDLRAGEAKIDSIRSDIASKVTKLNIDKADFLSERLGSVDSKQKLDTANKALINLGILQQPIESVGQARILFEGSKNFQLQTKLANEASQAKDKQAFEIKAKQEQARLNSALAQDRQQRGFADSVALERLKQQGRERLVQQKSAAGQTGGVNVNIDPSLFQGQAGGIQQRQFGGKVGAGESELDRLNREIRERGEAMNNRASKTFEDQLREKGIDTSLKAREEELGVNRKIPKGLTFEEQLEREGIKQFRSFEEQLEFERRQRELANRPIKEILEEIGPRQEIFRQPQSREEFVRGTIDTARTGILPQRQTGGELPGQPTLVGENGPEIIVPDQQGTVVPTNPQDQAVGLAQGNISPEHVQLAENAFDPTGGSLEQSRLRREQLIGEINAGDQQEIGQRGFQNPSLQGIDGINPGTRRQIIDSQARKGRVPVDINDLNQGFKNLPGTDKKTPESAAKIQMLRTGLEAADGVESLIFNEDGSVDRTNLLTSDVPGIGSVPLSEGRELRTKMEFGIQAITRAETGAAMPESEVNNTRVRFMPRVGDSDGVIKLKMKMFREFLGGTLNLIAKGDEPKFDDTKFQAEYHKRAKQDFKQRFLQANPGASEQDVEQYIKATNKSFLPQ